jgi:drug/metabolite transporter (DMT)-like permease
MAGFPPLMLMNPKPPNVRTGMLCMLVAVFFFAANTLLLRWVGLHCAQADGWTATAYRGLTGLLVVTVFYGFGRGFDPKGLVGRPLVVLRGVVGSLSLAAFYITIHRMGASRATVINLSYPIFATIIAMVVVKERVSGKAMLWIFTGFCGLVVFLGAQSLHLSISTDDLLGIFGAAGAGLVVVLVRKLIQSEHPSTIYGSQCFYCILFALPLRWSELLHLPLLAHLGLIAAGMLVSVAQLLMTFSYRNLSVTQGTPIQMLTPLATAMGGFFLFQEHFEFIEVMGALLTLFATWMVSVQKKQTPQVQPVPVGS